MPKEIKTIAKFLAICTSNEKATVKILRATKKSKATKFKARTKRCLYTLKIKDKRVEEELERQLPKGIKKIEIK